jgi:hypothetical protein
LLGVLLGLRASLDVLDLPSQGVWSTQKLERLEQEVRQGNVNAATREEIAALARAVYECSLERMRRAQLKWKLLRILISMTIFFVFCRSLCWFFSKRKGSPHLFLADLLSVALGRAALY